MEYIAYHRDDKGKIAEMIDVGIQGKFSYDPLDLFAYDLFSTRVLEVLL